MFNRIFAALAAKGGKPDRLMIDATHFKAHRTAASLLKRRLHILQTRPLPGRSNTVRKMCGGGFHY